MDTRPLAERFDGYSAEMLRRAGITSPIVGYEEEPQTSYEQKYGIGAQDDDWVPGDVGTYLHESGLAEAGEVYSWLIRGANEARSEQFHWAPESISGGAIYHLGPGEYRGTSMADEFVWPIERERGIPAW